MNSSFDPQKTLEWLYQKREEVDRFIQFIEREIPAPPVTAAPPTSSAKIEIISLQPTSKKDAVVTTIKPGQFEGLKIWEAARTFLEMTQAPQSTSQIATCLIRGGITSRAQNLGTNLYTVLKKKSDTFTRVGPGLWGLKNGL
jgi:hypothetical protein